VVPVDLDPIRAFRGSGVGGGTARLLKERQLDRPKEDSAERVAQLLQSAQGRLRNSNSRWEAQGVDHKLVDIDDVGPQGVGPSPLG
jgi:hypothetical protein